ncbi:ribonuclease HII [Candidatus Dojkabacteria bacterium]|uniref:Ribonuclease HII n=1 Tax=Candidatus Dojkabacteria bacterium TaxID=2099670 RepID=A0A955KV64_9BACT|nr:ribonuclease HII [Candidatus Dojkabacteria bacterium]
MAKIFPTLKLESRLWKSGYQYIVGVDEAGRGPWAGPVTAGAVVVSSRDQVVETVCDSKKMTNRAREESYKAILNKSLAWGVGVIGSNQIDSIGIQEAVKKAMKIAINEVEKRLGKRVDYIISDGINVLLIDGYPMEKIKAGDTYHYSIAAASVVAKVTRDRLMVQYAQQFPQYGFENHFGYGTRVHREALMRYGMCEIHRKSYKPIKAILEA